MDTLFSSVNLAEMTTYLSNYMVPILLSLAATVLICVSRWRIFKKLGLSGWKGIIPIYGDYTLFKNRWNKKPFWILTGSAVVYYAVSILTSYLMMNQLSGGAFYGSVEELKALMMPYIVISGATAIVYLIINFVIMIGLNTRVAESFDSGVGFAVGMTIIPFVFYPILAFSKSSAARKKRPLQMVSTVLTLALVFSIVTCAPFSAGAAQTDDLAATAAESDNLFGELSGGRYTLESTTYQLTADIALDGYLYVPSGVTAVLDLNGFTVDRGLFDASDGSESGSVIINDGTLTITDSSGADSGKLTGGYAQKGGAVFNSGTLTVEGGNLFNNKASIEGGAIENNSGATLNITGGRITHNVNQQYGGGAVLNNGTMNMSGGTISGNVAEMNGGGIWNGGGAVLNLTGGTVSGNYAKTSGSGIFTRSNATLNVSGSPVVNNNVNNNLYLHENAVINVTGTLSADAKLDVRAENAVNAENKLRAVTGGLGGNSASAFTFACGGTQATINGDGEVIPDLEPSSTTYTTAMNWADLLSAIDNNYSLIKLGDEITSPGGGSDMVKIDSKNVTIDLCGHSINRNRTSKSDDGHAIWVTGSGTLNLRDTFGGGIVEYGYASRGGGINVNSGATLNLYNVTVSNNNAIGGDYEDGGGIFVHGKLYINGAVLKDNCSGDDGAAIYINSSAQAVSIKNALITGNKCYGNDHNHGGAIYQDAAITTTIENTYICNNESDQGAIFVNNGTVNMTGGCVSGNTAVVCGGGVRVLSGTTFNATDTVFDGNTASEQSGGAINTHGTVTLTDCILTGNTAAQSGGAVFENDSSASITLTNTLFRGNQATDCGGAAAINSGSVTINGCNIQGNTASVGGGIWIDSWIYASGKMTVTDNTGGNLYLGGESGISDYGFTEGTHIGLTAQNYDRYLVTALRAESELDYFTLDQASSDSFDLYASIDSYSTNPDYYRLNVERIDKVSVDSWSALQSAINNASYKKIITLSADLNPSGQQRIVVDDKNIILDLAGHTMNRGFTSKHNEGNVFKVTGSSAYLTVRDSDGAGVITGGYADGNGGAFYVVDGAALTIQGGNITGNRATSEGAGIFVKGGTLRLEGGTISSNKAGGSGGGVMIKGSTTFTMSGGMISGNTSNNGAGVHIADDDPSFTMTGGTITGNTASGSGGGIFADYRLTITGGMIEKNKAKYGGGLYNDDNRIVNSISGAAFSENTATEDGGAIYLQAGQIDMDDCTIENNTSADGTVYVTSSTRFFVTDTQFNNNTVTSHGGGAIVNDNGRIRLTSCTLDGNTAQNNGGAIWTKKEATLINCTITNNKAKTQLGGGIHAYDGTLSLYGCTIKSNTAAVGGSGVYVSPDANIYMSGKMVIHQNAGNNLLLAAGKKINVSGKLLEGSDVNVAIKDNSATVTTGYQANHGSEDPSLYFSAMPGSSVATDSSGEVVIIDSEWTLLKRELENAENGAVVTLDRDWYAIPNDYTIHIPSDKAVTLDLNGYTIDAQGSFKSATFEVYGTLTVRDSSDEMTGKITGASGSAYGGAILVKEGGTFNLESGSISGNAATLNGGGINNYGVTNISGGVIEKNSANYGGGIYNSTGTLNITGGVITGNSAQFYGGGIYNNAELTFEGGEITSNNAVREGGGVFVSGGQTAVLNVGKVPVIEDNTAPIGNNILLESGKAITITSELNPGSKLDLVTKNTSLPLTSGYSSHLVQGSLTYNGKSSMTEVKNGELYFKNPVTGTEVDSWAALQNAITNSSSGDVIVMTSDAICSNNTRLIVNGKNITIELNGHVINRNRSSGTTSNGQVFDVTGGSKLTISDAAGTGIITGGYSKNGGGFYIDENATVTIKGGSIQGNTADSSEGGDGGGVYNKGTLIMEGGAIAFNKADDTGGGIYSLASSTTQLNNALITGNYSDDDDGGGLNLHFKDNSSYIKNSTITNNRCGDNNGGGIRVYAKDKTLLIENTHIEGNTAEEWGGGIHITYGTVVARNSFINNNTAKDDGGGVYVEGGGSFHAADTELIGNSAVDDGGGIECHNRLTLVNCKVNENVTDDAGGGIYYDSKSNTLTLIDTQVDYNKSEGSGDGGGIKVYNGSLNITRGSISYNRTETGNGSAIYFNGKELNTERVTFDSNYNFKRSGTVYMNKGNAHIKGGTFTNNFVKNSGGGVYVTKNTKLYVEAASYTENDTQVEEPVTFSLNYADQPGGAIYLEDDGDMYLSAITVTDDKCPNGAIYADEDFDISGKIIVEKGAGAGICMKDDRDKIHIVSALDSSAHINVALEYKTGYFTNGYSTYHVGEAPETYFSAQDGYSIGLDGNGEVRVRSTDWLNLQQKINDAANGDTITLDKTYTADAADSALVIPSGKTLTLDLHGFKLDGGGVIGGGTILRVSRDAMLTIVDHYTAPDDVEAEDIENYEGAFTGGTASAIVNSGVLTLSGGRIITNKAGIGGGITNYGVMTVEGGRIKSNSATDNGGGIYNSGTLYLYGGEIKNNASAASGGGIFCAENSKLYVKGSPYVKDNNGSAGKNIVLSTGVPVTIVNALGESAKLDVALKGTAGAITSGYAANGSPQGVFTYNENKNITLTEKNGELYLPYDVTADVWVSSWAELQRAVNSDDNQGKVIGLSNDLTSTGQERIEVENGRVVTIELAGHTMNRGFSSKHDQGNVFKVSGSNTHLTVRDTLGTGVIRGGYANGDGGGFYVVSGAKLTIESGAVYSNGASSDGGGIYVDNAELIMTGGAVSANYAEDNGAGIYTSGSAKIKLDNAEITFNTSVKAGGGFNIHLKENATFTKCAVSYNKTKEKDGGGIVMNASDKTLTLVDCKVNNNTADDAGGGIYVDAGTVTMSGGQVSSNTSDDGGGVYITGGDTFKATNKAAIVNNRTTGKSGGGITCHGDLVLNNATVALNHSAKYGGGVFYQNSGKDITLTNAKIIYNEAENDGGGLYIKQGEVVFDGGEITGNTSIDGGGVFVVEKTKFTVQNSAEIKDNISTQEDGGGIVNKGKTYLYNMTVKSNTAKVNGGGIWNSGTLTVSDCTIESNKAKTGYGGGIAHMDGDVYLKEATTIKSNQSIYGGGVYVEKEADNFYIEGTPVVTDNSGSNVYLDDEKITLNGKLQSGAKVSVSTLSDVGRFTKDFSAKNSSSQPNEFFISDYGYEVYKDDGEAALRWIVNEDTNPFIDRNNNIIDSDKVGGRNWMSAVSGERKLNEINLIRAHDAAMNKVEGNNTSSKITFDALIGGSAGAGSLLLYLGIMASITTGGFVVPGILVLTGVLGGLAVTVSQIYQSVTESQAKTQVHYIDEMMDMGVRVFDLRINNKNWEDYDSGDRDDGVNLWHCHGESDKGGCIYGCDRDGNVLSVNDVLDWAKEFLKKNPTEVLYFEYSPETQDNEKYDTILATRLKKILKEFSYEINPSTGKPYLYMEDGVFGKDYTYWPKLKDVRGQIIYKYSNETDDSPRVGGYDWNLNDTSPTYSRVLGGNETINLPVERIRQTESAIEEHPSPNILTDAMVHRGFNSGYYVNTTDDPEAAVNWLFHPKKQSYITETPLELEEKVLYGHGTWVDVRDTVTWYELHKAFGTESWYNIDYEPGYEGLLREGGYFNRTGEYYGIFSFDGVTEKEARLLWSSNFYDDIEYCTVTVKSGLAGDDTVKTYKVLKGTAITIPNCIYEKPSSGGLYFQNWKAETGDNNNWEPSYCLQDASYFNYDYTGRDNRAWLMDHSYLEEIDPATQIPQNSERSVMPGETITIMDNTMFTAVWGADATTTVSVVWNDGDDADGLRENTLKLNYQIEGLAETNTAIVEESAQWSTMLSGTVNSESLTVSFKQINATEAKPHGDPDNGYSYAITGDADSGFIITMTHTPQKTVTAAGAVTWDDNGDVREVRPDSVTLKLIKNGDKDNPILTTQVTEADGWTYNFGTFPEYIKAEDGMYRRDVYTVIEDSINCYTPTYDDFDVTNVYIAPDTTQLIVEINWKDAYNACGERPESVTLHLYDGETEVDQQVVPVDDEEATTLTLFDMEKYELKNLGKEFNYRIVQEDIDNYTTEIGEIKDSTLVIVNRYNNSGKYFQKHSLTLDGDIGVNFYIKMTPEEAANAKLHFAWFNKTLDLSAADLIYNQDMGLYRATCPVAAAEMTFDINATLYINDIEVEKDRYSVAKYANVILTDKEFHDKFIADLKGQGKTDDEADEKYTQLVELILTMLDYGANAQLVFDRNIDNLANGGADMFSGEVTSDMIKTKPDDMAQDLEQYGLEYQYSSIVFLSGMSLRHFYKIIDQTKYDAVKSSLKFVDEEKGEEYAVVPVKRGDMIYFQKKNIPASRLDYQYALMIGSSSYKYAVMDGIRAMMDSKPDENTDKLCQATYRYNQAANTFFGD